MIRKKLTLRQEVLNALVDDDENIVQIERLLKHFRIPFGKETLKKTLIELLVDTSIKITYPPGKEPQDFEKADDQTAEEIWFSLTAKGRKEWERIKL